jgi:hypothetical protein
MTKLLMSIAAIGSLVAQEQTAEKTISGWPEVPKSIAQKMIDKYGPPNEITSERLIWHDKDPWQEIIVTKQQVPHHWPMKHTDLLLQSIPYKVPPDKFDELAQYEHVRGLVRDLKGGGSWS